MKCSATTVNRSSRASPRSTFVWFGVLAVYLWGLFLWESVTCWMAAPGSGTRTGLAGADE